MNKISLSESSLSSEAEQIFSWISFPQQLSGMHYLYLTNKRSEAQKSDGIGQRHRVG